MNAETIMRLLPQGMQMITGASPRYLVGGPLWSSGINFGYSSDGVNWTNSLLADVAVFDIAFNGDYFLLCGTRISTSTGVLYRSENGRTWTEIDVSNFPVRICASLCWNGTMWLMGADCVSTFLSTALYSYDGTTWTQIATDAFYGASGYIRSIAWNGSMFMLGGTSVSPNANELNAIYTSTDGISWTARGSIGMNPTDTLNSPYGCIFTICWTGTRWVAGGYQTINGTANGFVAYSSDAVTWSISTGQIPYLYVNSICWTGSRLIIGGQGQYSCGYSTNHGTTWMAGSDMYASLQKVVWDGTYVFAVVGAKIMRSDDGGVTYDIMYEHPSAYATVLCSKNAPNLIPPIIA